MTLIRLLKPLMRLHHDAAPCWHPTSPFGPRSYIFNIQNRLDPGRSGDDVEEVDADEGIEDFYQMSSTDTSLGVSDGTEGKQPESPKSTFQALSQDELLELKTQIQAINAMQATKEQADAKAAKTRNLVRCDISLRKCCF